MQPTGGQSEFRGTGVIGSPGYPFREIFNTSLMAYLRRFLGVPACQSLELLHWGSDAHEALRMVAASAVSAEELVAGEGDRKQLRTLLSEAKRAEFVDRLGAVDTPPEAPTSHERGGHSAYGLLPP